MIEVTTRCGEQTISWQIELTVGMRKEVHRQSAINIIGAGDDRQLMVNTHSVLGVIVPGAIAGLTPPGPPSPSQTASGEGGGDGMAEWVWGLPHLHLDSLATQVGSYLYTGIDPADQERLRSAEAEGEDAPLPDNSASNAPPTNGTPPANASAGDRAAPPTSTPGNDGSLTMLSDP